LSRAWFPKWRAEDLGQLLLSHDGTQLGTVPTVFDVGDRCRTIHNVTIREEEDPDSDDVRDLPVGCFLQVVALGRESCIKVAGFDFEGWVTCTARYGEWPMILLPRGRRGDQSQTPPESVTSILADVFRASEVYTVKSEATVRTAESLHSQFITDLAPGTVVQVLEHGAVDSRRAKVMVGGVEGWLSLATRKGEFLLNPAGATRCTNCLLRMFSNSRRSNTDGLGGIGELSAPTLLEEALAFSTISRFQRRSALRHETVQRLPTFEFKMTGCSAEVKFEPTCSICLQDFSTGDQIKRLPCDHLFHAACVDHWLDKADTCPFRCEISLATPAIDVARMDIDG